MEWTDEGIVLGVRRHGESSANVVRLTREQGSTTGHILAVLFFAISVVFVWRSFYGMRIKGGAPAVSHGAVGAVARSK